MNTSEILKNIQELKKTYGNTEFPFDYYITLAEDLRSMKHLYNVVDKINKEDKKILENLVEGSKEYERRKHLLDQDGLQQHLRLSQIEKMSQEIRTLNENLNELINNTKNY